MKLDFSLDVVIQEERHKPVYCIKFCSILHEFSHFFATVCQNRASVYRIDDTVHAVQHYEDGDYSESLYTCTWADCGDGAPLLVVAGLKGVLKVINTVTFEMQAILRGHGSDIDDVTVHPVDTNLILSASKDESIRLWNIKTSVCIAIFAGEKGHRDDVLSIDIHPLGNCFVSAGMDTTVKVWNLVSPSVREAVGKSYSDPNRGGIAPFSSVYEQFPLFTSSQLHKDYVDSVSWIGNLILSKSTSNRAALWCPDPDRYEGAPCVLREFQLVDSEIWYMRFGVSVPLDLFASGTTKGKVCVYHLSPEEDDDDESPPPSDSVTADTESIDTQVLSDVPPEDANRIPTPRVPNFKEEKYECGEGARPVITLYSDDPKDRSEVRHVTFSPDGAYLVYSCGDGKLFVWSIKRSVAHSTDVNSSTFSKLPAVVGTIAESSDISDSSSLEII